MPLHGQGGAGGDQSRVPALPGTRGACLQVTSHYSPLRLIESPTWHGRRGQIDVGWIAMGWSRASFSLTFLLIAHSRLSAIELCHSARRLSTNGINNCASLQPRQPVWVNTMHLSWCASWWFGDSSLGQLWTRLSLVDRGLGLGSIYVARGLGHPACHPSGRPSAILDHSNSSRQHAHCSFWAINMLTIASGLHRAPNLPSGSPSMTSIGAQTIVHCHYWLASKNRRPKKPPNTQRPEMSSATDFLDWTTGLSGLLVSPVDCARFSRTAGSAWHCLPLAMGIQVCALHWLPKGQVFCCEVDGGGGVAQVGGGGFSSGLRVLSCSCWDTDMKF